MGVLILTENQLRRIIHIDTPVIDAIEKGFAHLSAGRVIQPPIMHLEIKEHLGDVDIKSAYVRGLDRFAVKIGAGFFNNAALGLPSSPAMMVVICAKTGITEAVLLDNAYLTDVRTAAAGAVAARHLAPKTVDTAGVIGAGAQGRYQILALKQVRHFRQVMVYDRDPDLMHTYAREMTRELDIPVIPARSVKQVCQASQVVVTCTPAKIPFVDQDCLHPGLHITAMGGDLPEKQELCAQIFEKTGIIACDTRSQTFAVGELYSAAARGVRIDPDRVVELGELVSGRHPGRRSEDEITVCDLSGTGVQDTMIAGLALTLAAENNLGLNLENRMHQA